MEAGLGHRHLVDAFAVDFVRDTDRDALEAGEHVELGQEVVGDAVDARCVAGDHGVEPPATSGTAGGHADLAPGLREVLTPLVEQFRGERTRADAGGVGLQNAEHRGDLVRSDTRPDSGAASRRIRRRHVGIRAVVDVEQRALRTLEQHRLATFERLVQQELRVGDAMLEALGLGEDLVDDLRGFECATVVDLDQDLVLEFERGLDLLREDLLVEHVGRTHADPRDLVLVAGPDTAAGRADLLVAEKPLGDLVDRHVIGHQQVGIGRDHQAGGVDVAVLEAAQLGEQHPGVDDDTVADDVVDARREDARGDQVQGERLTIRENDGVTRVVAALVSDNPLQLLAE